MNDPIIDKVKNLISLVEKAPAFFTFDVINHGAPYDVSIKDGNKASVMYRLNNVIKYRKNNTTGGTHRAELLWMNKMYRALKDAGIK